MKFYAVKNGRKPGVYTSWDKAKEQVSGYSGAIYKSFATQAEAEAFIGDESLATSEKTLHHDGLVAYVDGSFDSKTHVYGSGIVLLEDGIIVDEIAFAGDDSDYAASFQVPGEIFATLKAIEWAVEHEHAHIVIRYDFQNLKEWAIGMYQATKPITQLFKQQYDELSKRVTVTFEKVAAHTGVTYNERADVLAKQAIAQKNNQ